MFAFETDIAIIGAGPAGSTASIFLSRAGIKHAIFDRETFPRDKICGDALSGKSVTVLNKINPQFVYDFDKDKEHFVGCWGVQFVAPNGRALDIPFREDKSSQPYSPGFISKRFNFDNFLVKQIDPNYASMYLGCNVRSVIPVGSGMEITFIQNGEEKVCKAKMVIGAEGDRSVVSKKLAGNKMDRRYYAAGLRGYYRNVSGMHPRQFIELHFIEEALPGYLWIFPLPNNETNVGIGLLSRHMENKNIRLKEIMLSALKTHPNFKQRFANAELVDEIKGWGLPLGSVKRTISGERFLLTGDAASLIDPFTGEGIGNAMVSGMIAAQVAVDAIQKADFSAPFLQQYDQMVYSKLWNELKLSYTLQRLVNIRWLFNFVVNRAVRNKTIQETLSFMFEDINLRARLKSPAFYFKLLFNL